MAEEHDNNPEIKIFTNGSGLEGQAGAAAVLFGRGNPRPHKVLKFHLGSLEEHTSFEGKAVGLLLGVWLLCNKHIASILLILVYTDSQALVNRIKNFFPKPAQYLTNEILLTSQIINHCNVTADRKRFTLRWILGHSGVDGNEKVDKEAK